MEEILPTIDKVIIDGKGVIRFQHIGPIKPEDVPGIMDKLEEVR